MIDKMILESCKCHLQTAKVKTEFSLTGWALECYVCTDQFDNRDKCIKTSVQCREEEDACLSMIVWRGDLFFF